MEAAAPQNTLLSTLPEGERDDVLRHARRMTYQKKDVLYESFRPITTVQFPLSGLGSIVIDSAEGPTVECVAIGNEGMVGLQVFLDPSAEAGNASAVCQIEMESIVLDARDFLQVVDRSPTLQRHLRALALASLASASQSALCNRAHEIAQRCARWVLDAADRTGSEKLDLTHEFLAHMLGVHRPSVTIAMRTLEEAGLLHYTRGRIAIVDRTALEEASCACYSIVRREFERLLPGPYPIRAA